MKKYIIAALAALAMSASGFAQKYTLQVNLSENENPIDYEFVQLPVATFSEGDLVISSVDPDNGSTVEVRYQMEQVKSLTIDVDLTGIKDVTNPAADLTFRVNSTEVAALGLAAGDLLAIYDIAGNRLAAANADADGIAKVNIAAFAPGVYVAYTPRHSFKFIKK